ncbi:MAG: 4Fe-4S dicluster domain-containing protein [Cetobacterium sp.]
MDIDFEGFKYPKVNYIKCINCKKCVGVCPVLNIKKLKKILKHMLVITRMK